MKVGFVGGSPRERAFYPWRHSVYPSIHNPVGLLDEERYLSQGCPPTPWNFDASFFPHAAVALSLSLSSACGLLFLDFWCDIDASVLRFFSRIYWFLCRDLVSGFFSFSFWVLFQRKRFSVWCGVFCNRGLWPAASNGFFFFPYSDVFLDRPFCCLCYRCVAALFWILDKMGCTCVSIFGYPAPIFQQKRHPEKVSCGGNDFFAGFSGYQARRQSVSTGRVTATLEFVSEKLRRGKIIQYMFVHVQW